MSRTFALVDCNNFYASCEKLFRPDLKHTPIVVLSNNDGCVVARSKEAKALGIKMAVPLFQIQEQIEQYGIQTFSSNYALYADLSSRVMRTLEDLAPRVEVYSIDEAFLDLSAIESLLPLQEFGTQIKNTIAQWIGLSVCVGIAPTKTLAKLANHAAKKYPATAGVVDLTARERQQKLLALTPVSDIWGVGRSTTQRLNKLGIYNALELANSSAKNIRQQFSVVLERTVLELNGESCIELDELTATKQQIICSRSFGQSITTLVQMREAVAHYTARAAEKLRGEKQQAKVLTLTIHTSRFKAEPDNYTNSTTGALLIPSSDTRELNVLAQQLLKRIWRDGYRYSKASVMLSDFHSDTLYQPGLFDDVASRQHSRQLMNVLDAIQRKGLGKIFLARQGLNNSWAMKREHLSPAYTTQWADLPWVR